MARDKRFLFEKVQTEIYAIFNLKRSYTICTSSEPSITLAQKLGIEHHTHDIVLISLLCIHYYFVIIDDI